MEIELQTPEVPLPFLLKDSAPLGVKVDVSPVPMNRSGVEAGPVVTAIISVAGQVSVSLLASWLYDKLKNGKSKTVTINRKEVTISEGEIRKVVEEIIKLERK